MLVVNLVFFVELAVEGVLQNEGVKCRLIFICCWLQPQLTVCKSCDFGITNPFQGGSSLLYLLWRVSWLRLNRSDMVPNMKLFPVMLYYAVNWKGKQYSRGHAGSCSDAVAVNGNG